MLGKIALDTNIIIDVLEGDVILEKRIERNKNFLCFPIPVVGELLFGALKSRKTEWNLLRYTRFINKARIIPCDYSVAEQYSQIRLALKRQGTPVPENDLWIAACCLAHNIPLATRDAHFNHIPGIRIEKW